MGRLRAVQIMRIHADRTDDMSVDEVYFHSFIDCGSSPGNGHTPDTPMPSITGATKSTAGNVFLVEQGRDSVPHTPWGWLFPNTPLQDECCGDGKGQVSGSVYFFDNDQDDWLTWFGVIVAALISVGVTAVVTSVTLPAGPIPAAAAGLTSGVVSGYALARLWDKFIHAVSRDEYLGGIRLTFPCTHEGNIVETHDLFGASNGLALNAPPGLSATRVNSSSARYKVTIRAAYN